MEIYMFGSDQNLSLQIFLTLLSIWLFHKVYIKYHSWAAAWQKPTKWCAPNELDQPGHPPGLVSVFAVS